MIFQWNITFQYGRDATLHSTVTGFLTSNSVHFLFGQVPSNPSSMGTQTVPQQVEIVERIIELLLQKGTIRLKLTAKHKNVKRHKIKCFVNTEILFEP